jgi:hypothetical protein
VTDRTKLGPYTLRSTTERDRDLITIWIEQDPDHRDRVHPDFFLGCKDGMECFAVEDALGNVVFYIKMTRTLRLDIQFGPDETREQRERNMDAMREGFNWLHSRDHVQQLKYPADQLRGTALGLP